jgi:hypothetical protein
MKWGEVQPGHSFVSNLGDFFLLIGVSNSAVDPYAGTVEAGKRWLDLLYLISNNATGRIHFWHDTRCSEYKVIETNMENWVWP